MTDTTTVEAEEGVYEATAVIDNGTYGKRSIRFETGRLAQQASGAVAAYLDEDTMLLSATSAGKHPREGFDFFPLTVDVEERMYAAGRIPGSFFRREGRPSTDAILTCRLIDRPLRPTFVDGLRNEIQVDSILGDIKLRPHPGEPPFSDFVLMIQARQGGRYQRILLGHGDGRDARILRGQGQQRVINGVAGHDQDRPARPQIPRDQVARNAAHGLKHLHIGQLAPAVAIPFGQKYMIGRFTRPVMQPVAGAARHGAKRIARLQQDRPVFAVGADHLVRPQVQMIGHKAPLPAHGARRAQ